MTIETSAQARFAVENSAVWAAYGDALGWIGELTDQAGLNRRSGGGELIGLIPWRRRIGGRGGVAVELPAGTYSDDTQLRLSVCRSISPTGFDVEYFSRVELPVWLAYGLGGGRGTKAAASNMARSGSRWSANFPDGYVDMGGNGAAMRIQPHAWRPGRPTFEMLVDVMRDSVVTHGHPRAILGAALHALTVSDLLPGRRNRLLAGGSRVWQEFCSELLATRDIVAADDEIGAYWHPRWMAASGTTWPDAVIDGIREVSDDLEAAERVIRMAASPWQAYREVLGVLDLYGDRFRGAGTRTVIAALASFEIMRKYDVPPDSMMRRIASEVGSDTDTIATMFGAYVGCVFEERPPEPPLDWRYIAREASRLAGGPRESSMIAYPDLLTWEPPKTQSDALRTDAGVLHMAGLGVVAAKSEPLWDARRTFGWQWVEASFGQTMLVKRRKELPPVVDDSAAGSRGAEPTLFQGDAMVSASSEFPARVEVDRRVGLPVPPPQAVHLVEESVSRIRGSHYSAVVLGEALLALVDSVGVEAAAAVAGIVLREYGADSDR